MNMHKPLRNVLALKSELSMAMHLCAFFENVSAVTSYTAINVVADGVLARASTESFVIPRGSEIVAAYAGGTNLDAARIVSPSLLRVAYPSIRPINNTAAPNAANPSFQRLIDRPLRYEEQDTLEVQVIHAGAAADDFALLWISDGKLTPVPPGEAFWVRYTSNTPVTDSAWSEIVIELESLPQGDYAVVGMEHTCTGCVAARCIFYGEQGSRWRPGTLGQTSIGAATDRVFYDDSLGVWGSFPAFTPPTIEVLADQASSNHEGYLRLIKR